MPASLNKVMLIGNLTRDPELRYLPSGQPVTSFSIAVNRTYTSQAGEKKEEVSFIRVVVWGRRGEVCNEYLKKGSPAFVEGRLQSRSWDAQDGTKRSTLEVIAQNVQFLGRGSGKTETPVAASEAANETIFEEPSSPAPAKGPIPIGEEELRPDDEIPF